MLNFLLSAAVLMAPVAAASPDNTGGSLSLQIDSRGGISVAVSIEGAGPFRFLIDTGAARTVVADDLARALGVRTVARTELVTSSGSETRDVVRLPTVAVAGMAAEGLLAPVAPRATLTALGKEVRGILGQDFLSGFNYTLDYRRRRLTRDEPLACDAGGALPMTMVEGRPVVSVIGDSGEPLRLVPDTGAEVTVLFSRGEQPRPRNIALRSLTGAAAATLTTVQRLHVGGSTLRDVPALLVDRQESSFDGLLPLHGFAQVSFAAGARCINAR